MEKPFFKIKVEPDLDEQIKKLDEHLKHLQRLKESNWAEIDKIYEKPPPKSEPKKVLSISFGKGSLCWFIGILIVFLMFYFINNMGEYWFTTYGKHESSIMVLFYVSIPLMLWGVYTINYIQDNCYYNNQSTEIELHFRKHSGFWPSLVVLIILALISYSVYLAIHIGIYWPIIILLVIALGFFIIVNLKTTYTIK